jgi:ketosteroid isomerase-like protein
MNERISTPTAVIETFGRCLGNGDLDGALALYEPDAVFQAMPEAPPLRGHEAIREALAGFFALNGSLEGEIVKVHEAGGVALVANRWTLRGTQPDGTPVELQGTSADVLRRRDDGSWGILVDDPWGVV